MGTGKPLSLVTHEEAVAARANRIIRMLDGKIVSDERIKEPSFYSKKRRGLYG